MEIALVLGGEMDTPMRDEDMGSYVLASSGDEPFLEVQRGSLFWDGNDFTALPALQAGHEKKPLGVLLPRG